jgi:hypothetical protein
MFITPYSIYTSYITLRYGRTRSCNWRVKPDQLWDFPMPDDELRFIRLVAQFCKNRRKIPECWQRHGTRKFVVTFEMVFDMQGLDGRFVIVGLVWAGRGTGCIKILFPHSVHQTCVPRYLRRVILPFVAYTAVLYFSTLSHKRYEFSGGVGGWGGALNIKCVFWFCIVFCLKRLSF